MTNSQRQHGIGSLAPDEKIVGKPGGIVEHGVKQYGIFKKIKKGAKKLFKSKLGKAALIGGLGMIPFGGQSTWSRLGGLGGGKGWFSKGIGLAKRGIMGVPQGSPNQPGKLGLWGLMKKYPGQSALLGLGAAGMAAPFFAGKDDDEEDEDPWHITPPSITNIRNMARNRDPSLAFLPPEASVQQNWYTPKQEGGIVGLANGGQPGNAQAEQMLKMEYQKYRNQGGTMSYQQFKMAVLQQAQGQGPMAQEQSQMAQPQMAAHGGRIKYQGGQLVSPNSNGLRPGYAGDEKSVLEKFISPFKQIFSGQTGAVLGGDQKTINEFNVKDGWGLDNDFSEETISMIIDMNNKGMDLDTIVSLTGGDKDSVLAVIQQLNMKADGGRAGYQGGELVEDASMIEETPTGMMEENVEEVQGEPTREQMEALAMEIFQLRLEELDEEQLMIVYQAAMEQKPREEMMQEEDIQFNPQMAQGQMAQPQMAAEGGIMDLGGMEKDYRQEGGFVPLGGEEKADDVPARLSKNEFVFTADAVRNAGGGDIDQGAEVMQNMMENLESGGQISEDSQGGGGEEMISEEEIIEEPNGAQEMYDQQQMLQSRMG